MLHKNESDAYLQKNTHWYQMYQHRWNISNTTKYCMGCVLEVDLLCLFFQAMKKINSCSTSNLIHRCHQEMVKTVELRLQWQNDCLNPRARVLDFPLRGRIPRGKEYKQNILFKIIKKSVIKKNYPVCPFRVERVECGLPADQADLKPGDYVVFINKTNVVMMAEDDVMELIK